MASRRLPWTELPDRTFLIISHALAQTLGKSTWTSKEGTLQQQVSVGQGTCPGQPSQVSLTPAHISLQVSSAELRQTATGCCWSVALKQLPPGVRPLLLGPGRLQETVISQLLNLPLPTTVTMQRTDCSVIGPGKPTSMSKGRDMPTSTLQQA